MKQEARDDNRVVVLGYSKSRLEVFINGVIFLILHIVYDTFNMHSLLPNGKWVDGAEPVGEVSLTSIICSSVLMIISYLLLHLALFGGEGRNGSDAFSGPWSLVTRRAAERLGAATPYRP